MKTKTLAFIAAIAACGFSPVVAQEDKDADRPSSTGKDKDTGKHADKEKAARHEAPADETEFVQKAAKGGMTEVKIAQIAAEKASDSKVKEFAQQLVKDHTAANQELKTVAEGLKISLPEETAAKDDPKCEKLKQKTGAEFDKAFLEEMDHCHAKGIALFEAGRKVAKSSEVTAFIDKTLPVLKSHAQKIDTLQPGSPVTPGDVTPEVPRRNEPQPGADAPEVPRRNETLRTDAPRPDSGNPDNK